MAGTMSVGGLISGLKTDEIISKVMEIARRPQNKLQNDKAATQRKLAVWQSLNTRILALKTKCDSIASQSSFQAKSASSSDSSAIDVSASTSADPGTFYVKVNSRAQAHQVSSQTYASINDQIGTGTVAINFTHNSSKSFEVTIDSANNTLAGLRDAINKANKGVRAAIVNSGTSSEPAYRLILTSTSTGSEAEFTVNTSGLSGGTTPTITQIVQQADDAEITLGEGAGAITVTKNSNVVTDLIPGVTLNILQADPSKTIRIDVARNNSSIKAAIQDFVTQYNGLMDAIGEQFKYDSETGESGVLMGDYTLQALQMELESIVSSSVSGVSTAYSALSSVGITLDTKGHLNIDDEKLTKALAEHSTDVAKLFAPNLSSNSSYVSFITSSPDTKPSGTTGWTVDITQAARQSQVTAGVSMSAPLDSDEVLHINGITVNLTSGMTLNQVIAEINKYSDLTGVSALATDASGSGTGTYLTLRTVRYGSATGLSAYSSRSNQSGNTTGIGNVVVTEDNGAGESGTGVGIAGLDVAGTINGERCTGVGQLLRADPEDDNSDIKGLSLQVTSPSTLTTQVVFSKGIGSVLADTLQTMTSATGIVTKAEESLNTEIEDFDTQIAEMESRLLAQQERLYIQFNTMERQLSKLQNQSNWLTAALANLNKNSKDS
jgi:flagellar hook-associated protein 2